jgi:hypothetical protein
MITADHAMEQAHETARRYAIFAKKAYEDLFDTEVGNDRQAAATFMAGFMQAASADFVGWAIQKQLENINVSMGTDFEDLISLLSNRLEGKIR